MDGNVNSQLWGGNTHSGGWNLFLSLSWTGIKRFIPLDWGIYMQKESGRSHHILMKDNFHSVFMKDQQALNHLSPFTQSQSWTTTAKVSLYHWLSLFLMQDFGFLSRILCLVQHKSCHTITCKAQVILFCKESEAKDTGQGNLWIQRFWQVSTAQEGGGDMKWWTEH